MIKPDKRIKMFVEEFEEEVEGLPKVKEVEFLGSITRGAFDSGKNLEGYRFGESDIDVVIHGDNISSEVKRKIGDTFKNLVRKYNLGVEKAPFQHPSPIFIDSLLRRILYNVFKSGYINVEGLRQWLKHTAPPHEIVWEIEKIKESMEKLERTFLLPPLSKLLDKIR